MKKETHSFFIVGVFLGFAAGCMFANYGTQSGLTARSGRYWQSKGDVS